MQHKYLVWSNEHMAWWGPNRLGYYTDISRAGIYTRNEALEIVELATNHQNANKQILNELAISINDLPEHAKLKVKL